MEKFLVKTKRSEGDSGINSHSVTLNVDHQKYQDGDGVNFLLNIFSGVVSVEWASPKKIVARRHWLDGIPWQWRIQEFRKGGGPKGELRCKNGHEIKSAERRRRAAPYDYGGWGGVGRFVNIF